MQINNNLKLKIPFHEIAKQCNVSVKQVTNVTTLLTNGATVPFIARYRKEISGNLDEVIIEDIRFKYLKYNCLVDRKKSILKQLKAIDTVHESIIIAINNSWDPNEIEDIYLPFKKTKESKADIAIKAGLDQLANLILNDNKEISVTLVKSCINDVYSTNEKVIEGVIHILSKWISEKTEIRNHLRKLVWDKGIIKSTKRKSLDPEKEIEKFKDYFLYEEPANKIKSHRYLAIKRGESDKILSVQIKIEKQNALKIIKSLFIQLKHNNEFLDKAVEYAWTNHLKTSLVNELNKKLKEKSDEQAIAIFSENLKQLLLQPPVYQKRILAIDPGYRSGCKMVCLTAQGELLNNETIYPHAPQKEQGIAKKKIAGLVEQYKLDAIAIGNGTASRETERLIKSIRFNRKVNVYIVNEAGASVYSASKVARKEFPEYDVTVRGAVSIGRRLIDPLSELVKIEPQSIGVGQYQHDVDQKSLKEKLDKTVISVVNNVGVDLNTSSEYLLQYVSGIGPKIAENIIEFRRENGFFKNRKELLKVPLLGNKAFEQAAGFLRIKDGDDPLDNSAVHPEFYKELRKICKNAKVSLGELIGDSDKIESIDWENYYTSQFGKQTFNDVKQELAKPGRDPRKVIFQLEFDKNLKSIDDLEVGNIVPGIINNVTNFGAFVDIGIKENGLIHISNLANEYIDDPTKIVKVHQHVKAKVISIDKERKRIGLSLKDIDY